MDRARSEAFEARMLGVLNDAALALMTSIGHQVGLFDTMSRLPPATAGQIAGTAGLHERYVREWLGAMLTGRVVEYDQSTGTFSLPPEHAKWLTRQSGINNLALQMRCIPALAQVEDPIAACFKHGGGLPYSAYPAFRRLMTEDSAAVHRATLIEHRLPLVPRLVERLRFGINVLDVGCGSGHAAILMAEAFPHSHFVGLDLSGESIEEGRVAAHRRGLTNIRFEARDAAQLDEASEYDLITAFDTIHDQARPDVVLREIARALRPEGVFFMVEIAASSEMEENLDFPLGTFLYTTSCMHCVAFSLADGGMALGSMWGAQLARQMLSTAGFANVDVRRLEGDSLNNYFVAKRT